MEEKIRVVTGSVALTGGSLASAIAMFLVSILLARNLDKDLFGVFMFIMSIAAMSYLFTDFGIDSLANYFVQRYKDRRIEVAKYMVYLGSRIKIILILLTLLGLVVLGFAIERTYLYAAIFFVLFAPSSYIGSFLQSFQHFRLLGSLQILESVIRLGLVYVVLYYVSASRLDLLVLVYALPLLVCMIFATKDVMRSFPKDKEATRINFEDLKQEAKHYWVWFIAASIISPIVANVMQVMMGLLDKMGALAEFSIGRTLSNMIPILATSFSDSMTPSFIKKDDAQSVAFSLTDSIRYMLLVSVFLMFFVHFTAEIITVTFYSVKFIGSTIIFKILAYGILVQMIFIGLTPATTSVGRPDLRVKVSVLGAAIIVGAGVLLIPKYGAFGAAISFSCGLIASTVIYVIITFRLLKYRFPLVTLTKCLFAGMLAFIPLQMISLPYLYRMVLNLFAGGALYILILYLLKELKEEDFELLKGTLLSFRR
jgi:O-antigen/teichoic acid export membrane protein